MAQNDKREWGRLPKQKPRAGCFTTNVRTLQKLEI